MPEKTFKRETANRLLLSHWALTLLGLLAMYRAPEIAGETRHIIIGLAYPVYGFAAAAYGLDSMAKQIIPATKGAKNGV